VGHKTASVVMSQVFGKPAFPVDTHIHRLAQRWGLTSGASVEQTEADLKALFPEDRWNDLHLQIIYFGREHCPAAHDPSGCPICQWAAVPPYHKTGYSPPRPGQRGVRRKIARESSSDEESDGGSEDGDWAPSAAAGKGKKATGTGEESGRKTRAKRKLKRTSEGDE